MNEELPTHPARGPAPLTGRRVLDLSRVLAGPWCTMILADLGAEVIKIENPRGGDDTRQWGPPYAAGEAAYYLCTNRNKKSVAVNLAMPEGQRIVRELAAKSDIVVENYKHGGLTKFGLDYASLSSINPALVYCSISGYGRDSPLAERPGYDFVIQAEGGLMAVTGEPGGQPMKVGVAVADLFAGMSAVQAILAALIARDRDGHGQHVDMALFDCQLAMLANVGSAYLASGTEPGRFGNAHATVVPYQVFATADGSVVIAVGNDSQFAALCDKVLGRAELARDDRFTTNSARIRNRGALLALLEPLIAARPTESWLAALRAAGVPSGEVRSVRAALTSPECAAREMVQKVLHSSGATVSIVGSPLKLSRTPVVEPIAPPLLGQCTESVLRNLLAYDSATIERLRALGIIASSEKTPDSSGAAGRTPQRSSDC
jgi:crotonobetainyl-CoA:carnitine CoA-transferase CaiB-like acyl-CoA transferase